LKQDMIIYRIQKLDKNHSDLIINDCLCKLLVQSSNIWSCPLGCILSERGT